MAEVPPAVDGHAEPPEIDLRNVDHGSVRLIRRGDSPTGTVAHAWRPVRSKHQLHLNAILTFDSQPLDVDLGQISARLVLEPEGLSVPPIGQSIGIGDEALTFSASFAHNGRNLQEFVIVLDGKVFGRAPLILRCRSAPHG